jgi:hypothetical protein
MVEKGNVFWKRSSARFRIGKLLKRRHYVTAILREKIMIDEVEKDIVSETVEEALD